MSSIKDQQARAWAEQYWQLAVTDIQRLPGYADTNFRLHTREGSSYTFKISPPGAEAGPITLEQDMLNWLRNRPVGFQLPLPVPDIEGQLCRPITTKSGRAHLARLVDWVPGRLWAHVNPHSGHLLADLGRAIGSLCGAMQGFDHPAAHRPFRWDISQALWTCDQRHHLADDEQRSLVDHFMDAFREDVMPELTKLRSSVIHNDANDYNLLVSDDLVNPRVCGLIDFGDAVYTQTINELAVAITYAILGKADPLAAAVSIVRACHEVFPLEAAEVAVLYHLIASRLVISVTSAAINKQVDPDNEYLLVSERPAWRLLDLWSRIPPALAHYAFRHACGWEPCPLALRFREWVQRQRESASDLFPLVVGADPTRSGIIALDLSVGSLELGNNANFRDTPRFARTVRRILEDQQAELGIGGYAEVRPFYTTDAYAVMGNNGPTWRTVHLGLDYWGAAGLPVIAPYDGVVHSLQDNAGDCDYGPTVILSHSIDDKLTFYTLYGHLDRASISNKKVGDVIEKGQRIGSIGDYPVNGNWPPHLHFQVMLDLLGWEGDFPGVAFPEWQEVWLSICPDPALLQPAFLPVTIPPAPEPVEIIRARKEQLGRSLSISYRRPLYIRRGFGPYLYDHQARRYLDTVNNVAHVGHEHPRVVEAGSRQMAVLNTNTRYLHEQITAFAHELLATLPKELSVLHIVNSGSEANELALRMARTYTGRQDMIAIEQAYHGNTGGCISISSYKFDGKGGQGAPPTTHLLAVPDTFRGAYRRSDPEAGSKYAAPLQQIIARMDAQGSRVAGFIAESILSCAGQIVLPPNYLKEVYRQVRAAGGICIADEVQVGLGRVGSAFWGFALQGVVPDIVTIGKPLGNGHPLAAVACTEAVAGAFANGMEYFNTFGGNPVSCAIGRAVLQVVHEEGLQQQAAQIGAYLKEQLTQLQQRHGIIGDVRGEGLFLGIELVSDRQSLLPATAAAAYLANRMREWGILMSTDGPYHNVLKVKPPMCFDRHHADLLCGTLDLLLQEDAVRYAFQG